LWSGPAWKREASASIVGSAAGVVLPFFLVDAGGEVFLELPPDCVNRKAMTTIAPIRMSRLRPPRPWLGQAKVSFAAAAGGAAAPPAAEALAGATVWAGSAATGAGAGGIGWPGIVAAGPTGCGGGGGGGGAAAGESPR